MTDLSQEELKKKLEYFPETGVFIWRRTGIVAGCVDATNYIKIRFNGKLYYAHRLAWLYVYNEWPIEHIDHINRIKFDNRIENLRKSTHQENQWNKPVRIDNFLGVKGVSVKGSKFQVRINGRVIGTFSTIEEASGAYEQAAKEHFG